MYDLRHTAGVFRSSSATSRIVATMHALSARSPSACGNGVPTSSVNARTVAIQVRKSFAVKSAPVTSFRYSLTRSEVTGRRRPSSSTVTHDARQPAVVDRDLVLDAALAAKRKPGPAVVHECGVAVAQRRQAIALVVAHVRFVADPCAGHVEQAHEDRQHLVARQARQREIAPQSPPQLRQRFAERDHAVEFRVVAQHSPFRVIAVLLAPSRVAPGRLQVPIRVHADPHVLVGGRNGETGNALQRGAIPDRAMIRMAIDKAFAQANACNAGFGIGDVDESSRGRHAHRMDGGWRAFGGGIRHLSFRNQVRASIVRRGRRPYGAAVVLCCCRRRTTLDAWLL